VRLAVRPPEPDTGLPNCLLLTDAAAELRIIEGQVMSYAEHWRALAIHIKGLHRAGELYALFQSYTRKFQEARTQADLYRDGALAGIELAGYRYLIGVSKRELSAAAVPADLTNSAGVIYRHINIVIEQTVPSHAARTTRGRS
jgi:hypothetical protein